MDRKQYPLPCLAILDIKMPKYSGLEVCRHIRNNPALKGLPRIILSSSAEPGDIEEATAIGVNHYIVKSAEPRKLESELQAVFERWLPK